MKYCGNIMAFKCSNKLLNNTSLWVNAWSKEGALKEYKNFLLSTPRGIDHEDLVENNSYVEDVEPIKILGTCLLIP